MTTSDTIKLYKYNDRYLVFDQSTAKHLLHQCNVLPHNIPSSRYTSKNNKRKQSDHNNSSNDNTEQYNIDYNEYSYSTNDDIDMDLHDDNHNDTDKPSQPNITLPSYILPEHALYLYNNNKADIIIHNNNITDTVQDYINDYIHRKQQLNSDAVLYDKLLQQAEQRKTEYINKYQNKNKIKNKQHNTVQYDNGNERGELMAAEASDNDNITQPQQLQSDLLKIGYNKTVDYAIDRLYSTCNDCGIDQSIIQNTTYYIAQRLNTKPIYHSHFYLRQNIINTQSLNNNEQLNNNNNTHVDENQTMNSNNSTTVHTDTTLSQHYTTLSDLQLQQRWCVSGVTYGSSYLVYHTNPRYVHASHTLLIVDDNSGISCKQLIAANRLAGAVNKSMLLASQQGQIDNNATANQNTQLQQENNDRANTNEQATQLNKYVTINYDSKVSSYKT